MTTYRYSLINLVLGLLLTIFISQVKAETSDENLGDKGHLPGPGASSIEMGEPSKPSISSPNERKQEIHHVKKVPRISHSKKAPSDFQLNSQNGLSYWIDLTESSGTKRRVDDSHVFHSGDKIIIHYKTAKDGSIKIQNRGSSGKYRTIDEKQVAAGKDNQTIPFMFDNTEGEEKLIFNFSPSETYAAAYCGNGDKDLIPSCDETQQNNGDKDLVPANLSPDENSSDSITVTLTHQ